MTREKSVAAITFGCKVNQYETACILDAFTMAGYQVVHFDQPADVYIINSCTVTNRTDYKSRNAVRKALKRKEHNPAVQVVVTGCYAQRNPDEIRLLGPVDHIIDNNKKNKILDAVQGAAVAFEDIDNQHDFAELFTTSLQEHTRAFLKIQDGCDYYCAYCAVAYARGPSRSRSPENVLKQVRSLTAHGYKEFVLGGINMGLYGRDANTGYHLSHLIRDIADIDGVELIRLSSVEPLLFTPDLLDAIADTPQVCPHFHIPLQSGCDEILASMGRDYSTAQYAATLEKLRQIRPTAAFGIDIITGLPGETDDAFETTYRFLEQLDFCYLHVFSYSQRPGTRAISMAGQVKGDKIHQRTSRLTALSQAKKELYRQRMIKQNTTVRAVIERKIDAHYTGLTDHYLRLYVAAASLQEGEIVHCTIAAPYDDGITGTLL